MFCGWVNVAFGCDCVVNGGRETMRNVATTEGKKLLKEIRKNFGKKSSERKEKKIVSGSLLIAP